jgi:hypothetical protein
MHLTLTELKDRGDVYCCSDWLLGELARLLIGLTQILTAQEETNRQL